MSRQPELQRNYNFSDANLKQLGDTLLSNIRRDAVEFAEMGFTPARELEYITYLEEFSNYDGDERLEGSKIIATNAKNECRAALETKMRHILGIARIVFGENSGEFKRFGDSHISRQTDSDLIRTANFVISSATDYLTKLSEEGITPAKIQEVKDLKEEFDEALDKQNKAISERDLVTHGRIMAGNKIYALITKYAEQGKLIWRETHQAKYNDYVIYSSPANTIATETVVPPADTPPTI